MSKETQSYLKKLKTRQIILRLVEISMYAASLAVLVYMTLQLLTENKLLAIGISVFSFLGCFLFVSIRIRLWKINETMIASYLNRHYTGLEESTDLFLQTDDSLNRLQLLQRQRVESIFSRIYDTIKLPHDLGKSSLIFIASITLLLLFPNIRLPKANTITSTDNNPKNIIQASMTPGICSIDITVKPPGYTKQNTTTTSQPQIKIPEGSVVQWSINFSDSVKDAQLIFSGNDSLSLSQKGNQFTNSKIFNDAQFYQVQWRAKNKTQRSDYFKIEVVPDSPPTVSIINLPQFIEADIKDVVQFQVQASLQDDYSINDAFIIATVSKGSGESIKFREVKLPFTSPAKIAGKNIDATRQLDLLKLGLEPGDELYFYAEAHDNKTPSFNTDRTETFFITLRDTASENTSVDPDLGVDLMPEYFRSQRQIIIDTEKLLKDKKTIAKKNFNFRSNELGYDQKVLRLKYGEFLGEEFESGIAVESDHDHGNERTEKDEDVTKTFGHVHDQENEHNLVQEKPHEHQEDKADNKQDPLKDFVHAHDDSEEATFFFQSVKAKLKAALIIMWDAELYLRLYEPQKSLPYQYKALKLLKEISNDSRIYVHKTGLDAPPIKEDKRLTGDLSEIKSGAFKKTSSQPEIFPAIRQAISMLEPARVQKANKLNELELKALTAAGKELSALAIENPGAYLQSLSLIKSLQENKIKSNDFNAALEEILKACWKAIPYSVASPRQQSSAVHSLNNQFIKEVNKLKHE